MQKCAILVGLDRKKRSTPIGRKYYSPKSLSMNVFLRIGRNTFIEEIS